MCITPARWTRVLKSSGPYKPTLSRPLPAGRGYAHGETGRHTRHGKGDERASALGPARRVRHTPLLGVVCAVRDCTCPLSTEAAELDCSWTGAARLDCGNLSQSESIRVNPSQSESIRVNLSQSESGQSESRGLGRRGRWWERRRRHGQEGAGRVEGDEGGDGAEERGEGGLQHQTVRRLPP
jgi:hypothetical protein